MMLHLFAVIWLMLNALMVEAGNSKILITINQFVSHPALDQARKGIEKALADNKLYPDKVDIKFDNAQGNIASSAMVAKHQASLKPAFMVAIATPAAQSNLKAVSNSTTIAFVAVSDPGAAGLAFASNVIGVVDQPPLEELLEISLKILPLMKTIGVVFNSGEINSIKLVEELQKLALAKNIKIEKAPVTTSTNIKVAVQKLVGKVDVIYVPLDNTVVSALSSLIQATSSANIPVIANDPSLIEQGLLLALGADYFKSGVQLGNIITDKINGKELTLNIQVPDVKELKINKSVAEKLKITIPVELEQRGKLK